MPEIKRVSESGGVVDVVEDREALPAGPGACSGGRLLAVLIAGGKSLGTAEGSPTSTITSVLISVAKVSA